MIVYQSPQRADEESTLSKKLYSTTDKKAKLQTKAIFVEENKTSKDVEAVYFREGEGERGKGEKKPNSSLWTYTLKTVSNDLKSEKQN